MNSNTTVGQVTKGHLVYWESFNFERPVTRLGLVREVFPTHFRVELPDGKSTILDKARITGWDHCIDAFFYHM